MDRSANIVGTSFVITPSATNRDVSCAGTKLGIPRTTLESKIKRFGINKYGQKYQPS